MTGSRSGAAAWLSLGFGLRRQMKATRPGSARRIESITLDQGEHPKHVPGSRTTTIMSSAAYCCTAGIEPSTSPDSVAVSAVRHESENAPAAATRSGSESAARPSTSRIEARQKRGRRRRWSPRPRQVSLVDDDRGVDLAVAVRVERAPDALPTDTRSPVSRTAVGVRPRGRRDEGDQSNSCTEDDLLHEVFLPGETVSRRRIRGAVVAGPDSSLVRHAA